MNIQESLKKNFDMSNEESSRLTEAFQNKEFRDLFRQYLEEMSDPKVRAMNEKALNEMESVSNQQNQNKSQNSSLSIMQPEPVFCLKTRHQKTNQKVFINICQSDKCSFEDDKSSFVCSPNSRSCPDRNQKEDCLVFDITFHSYTLLLRFKPEVGKEICTTAINAVSKVHNIPLKPDYHVLVGVECKGGKPKLVYLDTSQTQHFQSDQIKNTSNDKKEPIIDPEKEVKKYTTSKKNKKSQNKKKQTKESSSLSHSPNPPLSSITPNQSTSPSISTSEPLSTSLTPVSSNIQTPQYRIIHRGTFEIGQFSLDRIEIPGIRRPRELVIEIELPKCPSLHMIELDVSQKNVELLVPQLYDLSITLPYSIDENQAHAKFLSNLHRLVLTLLVLPLTPSEIETLYKEHNEMLRLKTDMDIKSSPTQDEGDDSFEKIQNNKGDLPKTEIKETITPPVQPSTLSSCSDVSIPLHIVSLLSCQHVPPFSSPFFSFKQTNTFCIFIFREKEIISKSVDIHLSSSAFDIFFQTSQDSFHLSYSFPKNIDPTKSHASLSSQNLVLECLKLKEENWSISQSHISIPSKPDNIGTLNIIPSNMNSSSSPNVQDHIPEPPDETTASETDEPLSPSNSKPNPPISLLFQGPTTLNSNENFLTNIEDPVSFNPAPSLPPITSSSNFFQIQE